MEKTATGTSSKKLDRLRGQEKRPKPLALGIAWAAYVGTVACNMAFEMLKLGGTTSEQVSNEVFSWFTPAGYVFSIWPVIYLAMAIWLVSFTRDVMKLRKSDASTQDSPNSNRAQSVHGVHVVHDIPATRTNQATGQNLFSLGNVILFVVSCGLNVLWLATWHFRMIAVSVVIIALFMAVLGLLYFNVFATTDRQVYRIPISLYFSWISVATVANCMYLLTSLGLGEIHLLEPIATLVLAIFYLAQAALMKSSFDDMVFGLVVVWALVGIGVHLMPVNPYVAVACYTIAAAGLLVSLIPWEKQIVKTRTT